MKELADITIQFKELEDVEYDVLEEFLQEQHIRYEVINTENRKTGYKEDEEPEEHEEDFMDIWKRKMERE